MGEMIDWIGAEAERDESKGFGTIGTKPRSGGEETIADLPEHQFPGRDKNPHFWQNRPEVGHPGELNLEGEIPVRMIDWIGAEAERDESKGFGTIGTRPRSGGEETIADLPEHQFPGRDKNPHFWQNRPEAGHPGELNLEGEIPVRMIDWIGAEAERDESKGFGTIGTRPRSGGEETIADLPEHQFPGRDKNPHFWQNRPEAGHPGELNLQGEIPVREESWEEERARRIYRARTVTMLRRYMRYSIETGRLPSLLGREFFRTRVTSYSVVTFEDRVIFVHDMETCLNRLDEFSRQILARHILQEHDQEATARLLGCAERTIRTYVPIAVDLLSEILLDVGLLERIAPIRKKSCQGGETGEISVSRCEERKNKV